MGPNASPRTRAAFDYKVAQEAYLSALPGMVPFRQRVKELRAEQRQRNVELDYLRVDRRHGRITEKEYFSRLAALQAKEPEYRRAVLDLVDANTNLQALKDVMQRKGEVCLELALAAKSRPSGPSYQEYQEAVQAYQEAVTARQQADLEAARCREASQRTFNSLEKIRSSFLYSASRGVSHQTCSAREAHRAARQHSYTQKNG